MCLEDLRLGRGRINKPSIQLPSGVSVVIQADPNRVALLLLLHGQAAQNDIIAVYPDISNNGSSVMYFSSVHSMYLLKVEELGQLVTGPFLFILLNNSATALASFTEIYTEVNAPPLGIYKP